MGAELFILSIQSLIRQELGVCFICLKELDICFSLLYNVYTKYIHGGQYVSYSSKMGK